MFQRKSFILVFNILIGLIYLFRFYQNIISWITKKSIIFELCFWDGYQHRIKWKECWEQQYRYHSVTQHRCYHLSFSLSITKLPVIWSQFIARYKHRKFDSSWNADNDVNILYLFIVSCRTMYVCYYSFNTVLCHHTKWPRVNTILASTFASCLVICYIQNTLQLNELSNRTFWAKTPWI
jgi:hypothetical protein